MLLREDSRIGTVRSPSFQAIVCVVDFTYVYKSEPVPLTKSAPNCGL